MATKRKGKKQREINELHRDFEPPSPVILQVQPSSDRAVHRVTGESASTQTQSLLRKNILDIADTLWTHMKTLRVSHGIPSCHTSSTTIKQFRALQRLKGSDAFGMLSGCVPISDEVLELIS